MRHPVHACTIRNVTVALFAGSRASEILDVTFVSRDLAKVKFKPLEKLGVDLSHYTMQSLAKAKSM